MCKVRDYHRIGMLEAMTKDRFALWYELLQQDNLPEFHSCSLDTVISSHGNETRNRKT